MTEYYGPTEPLSEELHTNKFRYKNQTFYDTGCRIAGALSDNEAHRQRLKSNYLNMKWLPAGRVQRAAGSPSKITACNCFVSGTIEDSSDSIMQRAGEAFTTMRMGGGIGYDFSNLRPRNFVIHSAEGAVSSGPVSFMDIYNSVCATVASAGQRMGAQMATLRVDHPDIELFVQAKQDLNKLRNFNMSVLLTDEFMLAALEGKDFDLKFAGEVVRTINAAALWDMIMRSTWDFAEPGALFIDRINAMNNLHYCETISATNPCGEQPLPPHGACILHSMNVARYVVKRRGKNVIDVETLGSDVWDAVHAIDNVIETTEWPLEEQKQEALAKRRTGLGVTGMANALEACGHPYGTPGYIALQEKILKVQRNEAYRASIDIAKRKGPFPLFSKEEYLDGKFISTLPADVRDGIAEHGIRNSHLLSIAPTGTISLAADNVSSGIEPVFRTQYDRVIKTVEGDRIETVTDYGLRAFGVEGRPAEDVPVLEHVDVLCSAQKYIDSAVSKTINVGSDTDWESFKGIYEYAWRNGAKGCTTFRSAGKREGIFKETPKEGAACVISEDGTRSCE